MINDLGVRFIDFFIFLEKKLFVCVWDTDLYLDGTKTFISCFTNCFLSKRKKEKKITFKLKSNSISIKLFFLFLLLLSLTNIDCIGDGRIVMEFDSKFFELQSLSNMITTQ